MSQGLPDPTSAPDVDSRQWADAVSRTLMAERVVPGLRIPERRKLYLEELGQGRLGRTRRARTRETALRDVAAAWAARTKARGPSDSSGTIGRSLNSLATAAPAARAREMT